MRVPITVIAPKRVASGYNRERQPPWTSRRLTPMNDETKIRGAGGTPGGIAEFFLGLVMAIAGAYLIVSRVVVASGFWSIGGYNTFGLSLVPLIIGIGILFFNGKSVVGWLLLIVGVVIIFAGILM